MKFVLFMVAAFLLSQGCAVKTRSNSADSGNKKEKTEDINLLEDEDVPVIDTHIHAIFNGEKEVSSHIPMTQEMMLKEFKEAHVINAVSMGQSGDSLRIDITGHGIIHCLPVPQFPKEQDLVKVIKEGTHSCFKIYLGYIHQYAYDPNYTVVYDVAERFNVPVVFHTGDTYSTKGKLKYSDPLTIDEVAVDHPKVKLIIAHAGNPWIQSTAEVVYKNPNVYFDASAMVIGDLSAKNSDDIDETAVKQIKWMFSYIENPDKMMFGSDWPLVSIKSYVNLYKKAIPKAYWKKVFSENAQQVFNFGKKESFEMGYVDTLPVVQ